jgi:hypothetical protein
MSSLNASGVDKAAKLLPLVIYLIDGDKIRAGPCPSEHRRDGSRGPTRPSSGMNITGHAR